MSVAAEMKRAPRPSNEDQRQLALERYDILDSGKDITFDELSQLAAHLTGTPMSLISFVDNNRLWLKSNVGLGDINEMPRDGAFCSHAIMNDEGLVITNVSEDERFKGTMAAEEKNVQFYAGTPLKTRDGYHLGTLCIMDNKPRDISDGDLQTLKILARQVMSQIELRHNLDELAETTKKAVSLENLIKKYTSKSVWQKADLTVSNGQLDITDEEVEATYLFIDVVGFTSLSEKLGSTQTVETLNAYFQKIVEIVNEFGGDIDKFVGDQLFCIFKDVHAATYAALKIRKAMNQLNNERSSRGLQTLEFTMGLNSGHAIRANVGGSNRRDNTLIGNDVNIASRLQSVCKSGGILASARVYQALGGDVQSVQRVRLKLKNLVNEVHAHYIEAAKI